MFFRLKISPNLVRRKKNVGLKLFEMKLQKISPHVSPFSGICFINEEYGKSGFTQLLDKQLGMRCKPVGFSYSDIIQNLINVFFCGGDCVEDIQSHLSKDLKSMRKKSLLI